MRDFGTPSPIENKFHSHFYVQSDNGPSPVYNILFHILTVISLFHVQALGTFNLFNCWAGV